MFQFFKKKVPIKWRLLAPYEPHNYAPLQSTTDLPALVQRADRVRDFLSDIGSRLAAEAGGHFFLGPTKKIETAQDYIRSRKNSLHDDYSAAHITDFARGTILVNGNQGIKDFRTVCRRITDSYGQNVVVYVKDLYALPTQNGFCGLFLNVATPDGHIAEIQVHSDAYSQAIKPLHSVFKSVTALHALPERTAEQTDLMYALAHQRRQRLFEISSALKLDTLGIVSGDKDSVDSSFPVRSVNHRGDVYRLLANPHKLSLV